MIHHIHAILALHQHLFTTMPPVFLPAQIITTLTTLRYLIPAVNAILLAKVAMDSCTVNVCRVSIHLTICTKENAWNLVTTLLQVWGSNA